MFTVAWYKRAVYQFVQSRGREVGSRRRLRAKPRRAGSTVAAVDAGVPAGQAK